MTDLLSMFKVEIGETEKEIIMKFPYSRHPLWQTLKDEIKFSMDHARFVPKPAPHWRARNTSRSHWVLNLLRGENLYECYRQDLPEVEPRRSVLFPHQKEMLAHVLHKKQCIVAGEMGTGKTLVLIEALEAVKPKWPWYIAPRFSIGQLKLLFRDWQSEIMPEFFSYDEMRKLIQNWPEGKNAPDFIIFDESTYLKTPSSQRTQCALHLVEGSRKDHLDPYVVLVSGAPAPKSPKDWWSQCEIACPGYIRESNIYHFERRLALIQQETSLAGGAYPKLVTWWDDENKCKHCGELKDHSNHVKTMKQKVKEIEDGLAGLLNLTSEMTTVEHAYEKSKNEVQDLHRRMSGLVQVHFKKDCLDLPEMIYRVIRLEPSKATRRAAALISRTSTKTVEALTRLRELSDGFQYKQEPSGQFVECERCKGTGILNEPGLQGVCPNCKEGQVEKLKRIAKKVPCPKDEALKELLEECGDRIVIFGGFTATIDRVVDLCQSQNWDVIRVDGTTRTLPDGVWCSREYGCHPLEAFQSENREHPTAFVAHAATAKTSLTLTASNMIVYYSNTFNADDRIQSEARIHRIGMDVNKGAVIVDLIHLESDEYVRENLKKKRELQSITLGELQEFMKESVDDYSRY